MENDLATIKHGIFSDGALAMFSDNMPSKQGKHAQEAARRFAKMVYTVISQSPDLQNCTLPSLIKAASQSASLDLDIDVRGLAYLVPYKNHGVLEAQFQIGYLGLIELAYRSGKVKAISAHCILASEKGVVAIERTDGQYTVKHPFSYDKPTGKIVAVYATAIVEGVDPQTVVMRADEVEALRQVSKAPNSPAWKNHEPAMYKKTAIRQLAKFLPKSIMEDFHKAAMIDEQETFVAAQVTATETIQQQAGSETVATFEEPKTEPEQPKKGRWECEKGHWFHKRKACKFCPKCGSDQLVDHKPKAPAVSTGGEDFLNPSKGE